jgi:hypothetical protein
VIEEQEEDIEINPKVGFPALFELVADEYKKF